MLAFGPLLVRHTNIYGLTMLTDNEHIKLSVTNAGFAGLLPFFMTALGPWIFIEYEPLLIALFVVYSTIILAFMAGSLWAVSVFTEAPRPLFYRYTSLGVIGLIIIGALIGGLTQLLLMALGYCTLWLAEKLYLAGFYPDWYNTLRHKLTWIVIGCHMLCIFNLIHTATY